MGEFLSQFRWRVNDPNCLIKKVPEMGIVASNKKALEIEETYSRRQRAHRGVRMRLTMQERRAAVAS